jgi:putative peptidoglycan lipid II flippase
MPAIRGHAVSGRVLFQMVTVGAYTAIVKAAGALKVVLTARAFGVSDGLDAYLIAFLLPSFISDTLAGALSSALVPTYIEVREVQGAAAARRLYRSVLFAAVGLLTLVGLALAVLGPWALRPLALHFDGPKLALTASLFRVMSPIVPLSALNIIWRSILNTEGRFGFPAVVLAVTPLASIGFLLRFGHTWGVYSLAAGTLTGGFTEVILLGAAMLLRGFPILPRWEGRSPALDQVLAQYGPVIAGVLLLGGAPLIDQSIAAMLASGSVAALNYGTRLTAVLLAVGPAAVATAMLPHFSKVTLSQDAEQVRHSLRSYAVIILTATLPVIGFLIFFSGPLIRLFFERGQFTGTATDVAATVQRYSLLTIPPAMVTALVLRLISSLKANYLLMGAGVLSVAMSLALDLILTRWMGVAGIGLATAIVQFLTLIYLWRRLRTELIAISKPSDGAIVSLSG